MESVVNGESVEMYMLCRMGWVDCAITSSQPSRG